MRPLTLIETNEFFTSVTLLITSIGGVLDNSGEELCSDNSPTAYKHFLFHDYKDGDFLNLLGHLDNEPEMAHLLFYIEGKANCTNLEVSYPETIKPTAMNILEALSKLYDIRPCTSMSETLGGKRFTTFRMEVRPLELV